MKAATQEARDKRNAEILEDYVQGAMTVKEIGKKYGLSHQQVHNILDKERQKGWQDPRPDRREQTAKRLEALLSQPNKRAIFERYQELREENPIAAKMAICNQIAEETGEPAKRVYRYIDQYLAWAPEMVEQRLPTEAATRLMAEEFVQLRKEHPYATKIDIIRELSERYDRSVKNISARVTQYLLEHGEREALSGAYRGRQTQYDEEKICEIREEYKALLTLRGTASPQRDIIRPLSIKYDVPQSVIKENVADILKEFKESNQS